MLVKYFQAHGGGCCIGLFLLFAALWLCVVIAYRMNKQLPNNDEDKQDYHIKAIWIAPLTFFPILFFNLLALLLFTFFFGAILVILPLSFIFPRSIIIILKWLIKEARAVGDYFLKINMRLLREAGLISMPINA